MGRGYFNQPGGIFVDQLRCAAWFLHCCCQWTLVSKQKTKVIKVKNKHSALSSFIMMPLDYLKDRDTAGGVSMYEVVLEIFFFILWNPLNQFIPNGLSNYAGAAYKRNNFADHFAVYERRKRQWWMNELNKLCPRFHLCSYKLLHCQTWCLVEDRL